MTMLELKPCPFCGKDAQIAPDEIGSGGQHVPPYHAGCFRGAGCGIAFTADDPDEAIAEWNRRPLSTITPAEVGGLVEKIRQCADDPMWANHAEVPKQWLAEAATALEAQAAELAAKEEARAEQWRLRREAEGSRADYERRILSALAEPAGEVETPRWEAIDEEGNDNFATSIYEADYKGLLVARCNQNGNYPWQAAAIIRGLERNKVVATPPASAPAVPSSMVLVPVEPTVAMILAARKEREEAGFPIDPIVTYRAMLTAAQEGR